MVTTRSATAINQTSFSDLPSSVVASILSYTITDTRDFAKLRLLSRSIKNDVLPMVISSCIGSSSYDKTRYKGQFIKCFYGGSEFLSRMLKTAGDGLYDGWLIEFPNSSDASVKTMFFEGAAVTSILLIKEGDTKQASVPRNTDFDHSLLCSKFTHENFDDFAELSHVGLENGSFSALPASRRGRKRKQKSDTKDSADGGSCDDDHVFTALVTLKVPSDAPCIEYNDPSKGTCHLRCIAQSKDFFHPLKDDEKKLFQGRIVPSEAEPSDFKAEVLMHVCIESEAIWELPCDYDPKLLSLSSLWDNYQTRLFGPEGISIVDGLMSASSRSLLMANIDKLASSQDPVDYHPHSNNVVRDLVHPALYSYIEGESTLLSMDKVPPCDFSDIMNENDDDVSMSTNHSKDYWGRQYEASAKYQWLPTYFDIASNGSCSICDYVNNLVPREKHDNLYSSLEGLFSLALPSIEAVYSYARSIQPKIRTSLDTEMNYSYNEPSKDPEQYCSLRGQRLQVITKIVDYELGPGQTYDGVWHVEGMSHEEIVATALYILHRDDDIVGGDILFKRSFFDDEATFIFSRIPQFRPRHLDGVVENGLIPLGTVQTLPGRLVVFPNSHVHKVGTIENMLKEADVESEAKEAGGDGTQSAKKQKRRIVVFFLVNPEHRIKSTREVPPQQETMSIEKAFEHRLNLMKERKYTKQDWNVRDIELCEH